MNSIRYSFHAIQQYAIRTGNKLFQAPTKLDDRIKHAERYSLEEATEVFNITKIKKGDKYLVWYEPDIKERMCAIIRKNGMVVTVLAENMYGYAKYNSKIRIEAVKNRGVVKHEN